MKKTFLALFTLSLFGTAAQAESLQLESGLVVKQYPEVSAIEIKEEPTVIVIKEQTLKTVVINNETTRIEHAPQLQKKTSTVENVVSDVAVEKPTVTIEHKETVPTPVKTNGVIVEGERKPGYTPEKTTTVYNKSFLGIDYDPQTVVVEPAQPIYFGKLYFNNLTCEEGKNDGAIELFSNTTEVVVPVLFCPSGFQTNLALSVTTFDEDTNKLTINLGNQKINVEKGFTSLYNLTLDPNNVVNFEFIYQQDEHPVRY